MWTTRCSRVENSVENFVDRCLVHEHIADDDASVQREGEGEGRVSDDRIAQVAIDFISFCFARRAVEWPLLYDEMCYVASNRLYRGLGYEELREVGLDLTLGGLVKTSRIANEVTRHVRDGERTLRGGLVPAAS